MKVWKKVNKFADFNFCDIFKFIIFYYLTTLVKSQRNKNKNLNYDIYLLNYFLLNKIHKIKMHRPVAHAVEWLSHATLTWRFIQFAVNDTRWREFHNNLDFINIDNSKYYVFCIYIYPWLRMTFVIAFHGIYYHNSIIKTILIMNRMWRHVTTAW